MAKRLIVIGPIIVLGLALVTAAYGLVQQSVRESADIVVKQELGSVVSQITSANGDPSAMLQFGIDKHTVGQDPRTIGGVMMMAEYLDGTLQVSSLGASGPSQSQWWPKELPTVPTGLLEQVDRRVTWQPTADLRFATVITPSTFQGRPLWLIGFINLAPYELAIHNLTMMWLAALLGVGVIGLGWLTSWTLLERRHKA
ncbi:MAG: hypothetical protein F2839_03635 [Actinobacteria bacterium]|uniref:Unannotated protein n=1 Tax=freshwater metagenome TaxID=449393 RepID=A0A6J5Z4N2_9ZZZZ|nr:hypothetical protein [Actinomycetota bacterium]